MVADELCQHRGARDFEMNEPASVNESLLKQRLGDLEAARKWVPGVLAGLERFIRTAGDYDLFRVNPIQYASTSGLSEADSIELGAVHAYSEFVVHLSAGANASKRSDAAG